MKSDMNFQKLFFILSILIIPLSSLKDDDIIDITDYTYPKKGDKSYIYIPILGSNDLHGGIFPSQYSDSKNQKYSSGGANYLYSYKKILKDEWGERLIWLDAGDQIQGTMECMLSDGYIMKDFYNKAGLDLIALGNHDFDYGVDFLKEYIKQMNFPLIVTNIKEKSSNKYIYDTWQNVISHKIFEFVIDESDPNKVIKIGVIGLTTTTAASQTSVDISDLTFTDYIQETIKWNTTLREEYGVNAVIVITHFGPYCSYEDNHLTLKMWKKSESQKQCEDGDEITNYLKGLKNAGKKVDGVIAGHRHSIAHLWISNIPVIESSGSDYINILYLAFRYSTTHKRYEINEANTQIEGPIPICEKIWPDSKRCEYRYADSSIMKKFKFHQNEITLDLEMKQLFEGWEKIINEKLDNNLAETEIVLGNELNTKETVLTNLINDIGRIITQSDICFYNEGGIRTTWYKGPINEIDNFRMFPFNNTWVSFEMTGEEVFHLMQDLNYYYIFPTSGLIQTFTLKKSNYYVKSLLVYDGFEERPLNPKKIYKVCTNDFLADGGGRMSTVRKWYTELRNRKDYGIIRDLVKEYLKKMKGKIREDKFIDPNHPKINIEY